MQQFLRRVWYFIRQGRLETDLAEELEFHRAMKQQELESDGVPELEAASAARRQLGNETLAREDARAIWIGFWLQHALQDVRYAGRMLTKSPGFTSVAVLTIALGIGANAAVFSVFNGIFFKPLPVPFPEQLVHLTPIDDGRESEFSLAEYQHYRERSTAFSGIAASSQVYMADGEDAREVDGAVVSGDFFKVLGIEPSLGRFFLPEEDAAPGREPVVVLGYEFWRQRFGGDRSIVGKAVKLNGTAFTVIGVAPERFRALRFGDPQVDAWITTAMFDVARHAQRVGFMLLGRLKPGLTITSADAEVRLLSSQLDATLPQPGHGRIVELSPVSGVRGVDAQLPRLLLIGVSCLLLIACANLAGLLIARGLNRRREMATRLALGATGPRLVRQMLTESLVLALLGILPGLLIAKTLIAFLGEYYAAEVEGVRPYFDFGLDPIVVAYAFGVAIAAGLFFGAVPGLQAARVNSSAGLKAGAADAGYRRSKLRASLLVAQVALSVVLLITAGLMLQSLNTVLLSPGFDSQHVAFIRMKTNLVRYPAEQASAYFREVARRLEGVPGVEAVSFAQFPPVLDWAWGCGSPMYGRGGNVERPEEPLCSLGNNVTPQFFETMRVPVLRGRVFDDRDPTGARPVAVVNEALARRFWPGQDPVGMTIIFNKREYEIVGLVRYLDYARADGVGRPYAFFPARQPANRMLVRVAGNPGAMLPTLRREIKAVDPEVPISEEMTLSDMIANTFMPVQLASTTLSYAGVLGLLLSGIGLYGVLAFSVSQRTREIGIRMAIGAQARDVQRLVLYEGLMLVIAGIAVGTVVALASTRLLVGYLYGVSQTDSMAFVAGPAVLIAIAALATYLPARRAARTNPLEAIRSE
ncbi:MAG: FtsX-like permease family protein [Luteitalea sp.]|nr:FtsX-like permease family protein [Luteitalea sp.]